VFQKPLEAVKTVTKTCPTHNAWRQV